MVKDPTSASASKATSDVPHAPPAPPASDVVKEAIADAKKKAHAIESGIDEATMTPAGEGGAGTISKVVPDPHDDVTIDILSELPAADGPADADKVPDEGRERGVESIPNDPNDAAALNTAGGASDRDSVPDDAGESEGAGPDEPDSTEGYYNGPGSESRRLSADPPQAYTGAG